MKKSAFLFVALVSSTAFGQSEGFSESAKDCVARLGSPVQCFAKEINYAVEICSMTRATAVLEYQNLRLSGMKDVVPSSAPGSCVTEAKKSIKSYYDTLLKKLPKKPAAQKAAKESIKAAFAALDSLPASGRQTEAISSALADLEIEAPN